MQMFQMNLPEMQFKWTQCRRMNLYYFNMTVNYLPAPLYFINNQFLSSIIYLLHLLQTYISSTQGALLVFLHMLLWFEWRLFFFTRTHSFSFTISVPHLKYKWLTLSADFSDWQGNTCRIYVSVCAHFCSAADAIGVSFTKPHEWCFAMPQMQTECLRTDSIHTDSFSLCISISPWYTHIYALHIDICCIGLAHLTLLYIMNHQIV